MAWSSQRCSNVEASHSIRRTRGGVTRHCPKMQPGQLTSKMLAAAPPSGNGQAEALATFDETGSSYFVGSASKRDAPQPRFLSPGLHSEAGFRICDRGRKRWASTISLRWWAARQPTGASLSKEPGSAQSCQSSRIRAATASVLQWVEVGGVKPRRSRLRFALANLDVCAHRPNPRPDQFESSNA